MMITMKKRVFSLVAICIAAVMLSTGCGLINGDMAVQDDNLQESSSSLKEGCTVTDEPVITLTSEIQAEYDYRLSVCN